MKTGRPIQGNQTLAAVGTANLFAAPGATKRNVLKTLIISNSVLAASSFVSITDGTTTYLKWDTAALRDIPDIDFGDGFYFPLNKAVVLAVTGGNSTIHAMATGEIRGH